MEIRRGGFRFEAKACLPMARPKSDCWLSSTLDYLQQKSIIKIVFYGGKHRGEKK